MLANVRERSKAPERKGVLAERHQGSHTFAPAPAKSRKATPMLRDLIFIAAILALIIAGVLIQLWR
jgi:hypothetical protein